jgi:type IV secretory pathway protease TraF
MVPHLRPGVLVLATGWYQTLEVRDVVVINHDGLEKIKRISKIDRDTVYLLGDNPGASTDGRHFGWLPFNAVVAKVIWPR